MKDVEFSPDLKTTILILKFYDKQHVSRRKKGVNHFCSLPVNSFAVV